MSNPHPVPNPAAMRDAIVSFPAVPSANECGASDAWRSSGGEFQTPAYPIRYVQWHNACVCEEREGRLAWSHEPLGHSFVDGVGDEDPGVGVVTHLSPLHGHDASTAGPCGDAWAKARPNRTTLRLNGTSILTSAWDFHAAKQGECFFPLWQLVQGGLATRMHYLVPPRGVRGHSYRPPLTPFVVGLLEALKRPTRSAFTLAPRPGERVCFEEVAECRPNFKGWHSMRHSKLVPRHSGSLSAPTREVAATVAAAVAAHCNLPVTPLEGPPRTARLLLRPGNDRPLHNLNETIALLERHVKSVEVLYMKDLSFCTQASWLAPSDLVVSPHGSHLVNRAFMREGTHLIEILPYLYEQDANNAGCALSRRHVLVANPAPFELLPAGCRALGRNFTIANAIDAFRCRTTVRDQTMRVPLDELERLLGRIANGTTSQGRFDCGPRRCSYA